MCSKDEVVDGTRLPRLMAAICETQRIRSITPVGIPHGCVEVSNYIIKKDSKRRLAKIYRDGGIHSQNRDSPRDRFRRYM